MLFREGKLYTHRNFKDVIIRVKKVILHGSTRIRTVLDVMWLDKKYNTYAKHDTLYINPKDLKDWSSHEPDA